MSILIFPASKRIKFTSIQYFLIAYLVFYWRPALAQNLVTDGGAESSGTGWTLSGCSINTAPSLVHGGTKSFSCSPPFSMTQSLSLTPGVTYHAEFYGYDPYQCNIFLQIDSTNIITLTNGAMGGYVLLTASFVATAASQTLRMYTTNGGLCNGGGTNIFDDISVTFLSSRIPTALPSRPPTWSPTATPSTTIPSATPTFLPTVLPTAIPTFLPTASPTQIPTFLPTVTPTRMPTGCPSSRPSGQPSHCPSGQPSTRPSRQPSSRPTSLPTRQPTASPTDQPSSSPSRQPTVQPTSRPSNQPIGVPTSQPTSQPSARPSGQPTRSPSGQPTAIPSIQPSSRPSSQPTARPSNQPSSQPSSQPTRSPSGQPTSEPSVQPTSHPTHQPSSQPTRIPSSQPTGVPSRQPSSRPSSQPSSQPTTQPSSLPSVQPSSRPTGQPSGIPSGFPSTQPSALPTSLPSSQPSAQPLAQPSGFPSSQPTGVPSSQPSIPPTAQPSSCPSAFPSSQPTSQPTAQPSSSPSVQPSGFPTDIPTGIPSTQPSVQPTSIPTNQPTTAPSIQPSSFPTTQPSSLPSSAPSVQPSQQPTTVPSVQPTSRPTDQPSQQPSVTPSSQPSSVPSTQPSSLPSAQPTTNPSSQPTTLPTCVPTDKPTGQPSGLPTRQPSSFPSSQPTNRPSVQPSTQPTDSPSAQPSSTPSSQPTTLPSRQPYSCPTAHPSTQPTTVPSSQPSSHPTAAPVATVHLFTKGVLFFLGDSIYSATSPTTTADDELLGESYILFGRNYRQYKGTSTFPPILSLVHSQEYVAHLNDSISGISSDVVTRATTILGDINNDGFLDIMVGLPLESRCLVYLGNSLGVETAVSFSIIGDPERASGQLGWSSTRVGDRNRDGFDEIVVSAPFSNAVYFIYGRKEFHQDILINNLLPGEGIRVVGSEQDTKFGVALALIHDFNKDGFQDIAITATRSGGANVVYILFGQAFNFGNNNNGIIQIDQLISSNPSSCLRIIAPYLSYAGFSIAGIGDINSDGYNDLAIGSVPINNAKYGEQRTYIIYGRENFSANKGNNDLSLSTMTEKDGFIITGGGFLVGGVGDVNEDGIADLMITNYDKWKGRGNAYLVGYPKYVAFSPTTFQPSSFPSVSPSSSTPSTVPTEIQFPTNSPNTFEANLNFPTTEGATFPPSTPSPTRVPKTSKPTRTPTIKPSTHSPTSPPPTVSPSIIPTVNPTRVPTITVPRKTIPPSRAPSTQRPVLSVYPSSSPSVSPTVQVSSPSHEITIVNAGEYRVPGGKGNFIITGEGSFDLTSDDGGEGSGKKIYTILPAKNSITIHGFNKRNDQINLEHFSHLYSIDDLVYRTNPLQIFLSSEQKLILSSVDDLTELTEDNFVFGGNGNKESKVSFHFDLSSVICLGVLVGCVGLFGCVTKLNKDEDNSHSNTDEKSSHDTQPMVIVDNLQKEYGKELQEKLSSELGSFLFSSSDSEGEEEDDDNDWSMTDSSIQNGEETEQRPVGNENDIEESLEENRLWKNLESVLDVLDPEDEEGEQSFVFTESDDQQSTDDDDDHVDIEGNYRDNNIVDITEEDISIIRKL
jgi:hypothetical protein